MSIMGAGGLGASTILGSLNNKLLPAAIMWVPTGAKIPQVKDTGFTSDSSYGTGAPTPDAGTVPPTVPSGGAPITTRVGDENENYLSSAKSLIFSCMETEGMEISSTVSNHPVSTGFNVSDHVFRNNPVVTLNGVVSNIEYLEADFTSLPSILKITGAILQSPLGGLAANAIEFGKTLSRKQGNPSNTEHFHSTLEQLCATGQLVQIATIRGIYANCIITKYTTSASADTSSTLSFTLTLERVNVVSTKNADGTPSVAKASTEPLIPLNSIGREKINRYKEALGIGATGTIFGIDL